MEADTKTVEEWLRKFESTGQGVYRSRSVQIGALMKLKDYTESLEKEIERLKGRD